MAALFPLPVNFSDRNHWPLSDLIAYEHELAGKPPPDPLNETYLTAAQVRRRYGGVSQMWLWRRIAETRAAIAKSAEQPP
jgi:hypothetical protein